MNKSWAATLTPLAGLMAAMIGKTHPALAELITVEMIMGLLAMLGITSGTGLLAKKNKDNTAIQKEKIALEREQLEVEKEQLEAEKKKLDLPDPDNAIEKIKEDTKKETMKTVNKIIDELDDDAKNQVALACKKVLNKYSAKGKSATISMSPEQFEKLSVQQQDTYVNSGGLIDPYQRDTGDIKWNNAGWYDTTFEHDKEKGNVVYRTTKYLYVRVEGAKSGHTVVLKKENGNVVLIDQKAENQYSKLQLSDRDGSPLPIGKYKLIVTAMTRGTSYTNSVEDEFEIV